MRNIFGAIVAFAVVGATSQACAQASASVTTNGTAKIVQPITLTKVTDLAFGTIVKSSNATTNTFTIDPTSGALAVTGSGTGVADTSTTATRAAFTVGGEGGQTFSLTVPASFVLSSSGNNITVTLTNTGTTGTLSNAIGSAGSATVGVGGNFAISNTQASGAYSGTFTTTVAYN